MRVMWFTNVWNLLFPPTEVLPGPDPLRASDDEPYPYAECAHCDGWDHLADCCLRLNSESCAGFLAAADGEVKP